MCKTFSITTIVTADTGGSIAVTGGITVHTIAMIAVIGDHHLLIATVQPPSIVAATRIYGGVITAIAPIEPTITRSSLIMGHDASAIRPISKAKKPRFPGALFSR